MKRILLVDHNEKLLDMNARLLRTTGQCSVDSLHTSGIRNVDIPSEHYDIAVVSSLIGREGLMLLDLLKAERKIFYCGEEGYRESVIERGFEAHPRSEPIKKVIGGLN